MIYDSPIDRARCRVRLTVDAMWKKKRKKADIPVYSFAEHQRQPQTTTLYSPRVLILEGILALDPRIADLLDIKVDAVRAGAFYNLAVLTGRV